MSAATTITVRVPLTIQKRGGRTIVMAPDGSVIPAATRQATTPSNSALVKALARAFRWKRLLDEGRYASVSDIARVEKIDRTYVGDILRLTLLAPDIVEAIMDGRHADGMTLPGLMKGFPVERDGQRDIGRPTVVEV